MTQPSLAPAAENFNLRQPRWLAAILLTLLIAGFHFYFLLHAGGFWRDEVNLINVAGRHSLGEIAADSFPVLMPLLVKTWGVLGLNHDDIYLRLLGISIGLGCVAALWLATWTARRAPPLVSLALVGLNSTVISFGDSLRAYGLGSLTIALLTAATWFFLKKTSWQRAAGVALAAAVSAQSLFHNAVPVERNDGAVQADQGKAHERRRFVCGARTGWLESKFSRRALSRPFRCCLTSQISRRAARLPPCCAPVLRGHASLATWPPTLVFHGKFLYMSGACSPCW